MDAVQEKKHRGLPVALNVMDRARDRIYAVGDELKKRLVLRDALREIAADLEDAIHELGAGQLEHSDELADMERLARLEIAEVATRHVVRLPIRSRWRQTFMLIGELGKQEAVEALNARMGKDEEIPKPSTPEDLDERVLERRALEMIGRIARLFSTELAESRLREQIDALRMLAPDDGDDALALLLGAARIADRSLAEGDPARALATQIIAASSSEKVQG